LDVTDRHESVDLHAARHARRNGEGDSAPTDAARDGCGAFVGNASGTHVKPPSLEAAMSLTVVVL
jgi:hypothetical protein